MSTVEIRDLALQLPPQERAQLAHDLLISLGDAEATDDVDAAWIEEIEARAAAYEAGELHAEDWDVSLAKARQQLREGQKS